jgi:hypothetical protein
MPLACAVRYDVASHFVTELLNLYSNDGLRRLKLDCHSPYRGFAMTIFFIFNGLFNLLTIIWGELYHTLSKIIMTQPTAISIEEGT